MQEISVAIEVEVEEKIDQICFCRGNIISSVHY